MLLGITHCFLVLDNMLNFLSVSAEVANETLTEACKSFCDVLKDLWKAEKSLLNHPEADIPKYIFALCTATLLHK